MTGTTWPMSRKGIPPSAPANVYSLGDEKFYFFQGPQFKDLMYGGQSQRHRILCGAQFEDEKVVKGYFHLVYMNTYKEPMDAFRDYFRMTYLKGY